MATISDTGRNVPSPWSHLLRGPNELEVSTNPTQSSPPPSSAISVDLHRSTPSSEVIQIFDGNSDDGATKSKKPVWNVPANGIIEVHPVMGASWPALSESARASPKSSSDSLKALGDGSVTVPVSSQVAVIPSSPQKQNSNNNHTNPNSTQNHNHHMAPTRQKSMKQRGGGLQAPPSVETTASENFSDKIPAAAGVDSSPREVSKRNNNLDNKSMGAFGSQQAHGGGGNDQPRGAFRRGNGGGHHPRGGGDGPYHSNYGSRRDPDRQNQEWNPHQNFNGRDFHSRQPRGAGPRGFVRQQPPSPPPFITPPVRHYAGPIGFPDLHCPPVYYVPAPPPESLAGVVPYVAAPPGMFISAPDPQLRAMLVKQIDYYFSPENLCKDIFLRQNMDEQGWVPIPLIAGFNRIKQLTMYIPFILEAVRTSTIVEVQGDKIRKRNDWMNWLLPPPNVFGSVMHSPQSPNYDTLATRMQYMGLESTANHNTWGPAESHTERVLTRSSSGEPSSQLHSNWELEPTNIQRGSNRPASARSLEKSGSC
ncbi:hypothetical protein MRB53_001049 [Persea americana]|uniref:Uncharacterized protein n=1 Tax=Persea americana TaxID=3435 RepID=A0ACC2MQK7_PERAE|nr:hypothetical protein MRB53_001049 [Persea americana]